MNAPGETGRAVLYESVGRRMPFTMLLIKSGANVNAADDPGTIPSHLLDSCNPEDGFQFFLAHGARPDVKRKTDGLTPLHCFTGQLGDLFLSRPHVSNWNEVDAQVKYTTTSRCG
jgi:ankyrin repeat protein